MTWNWHTGKAFNYESKKAVGQILMGSSVQQTVDLSRLMYGAPAKLMTCCRHGVNYGENTAAGQAFNIIHRYLVPERTNYAMWHWGEFTVENPTGDVLAWMKLMPRPALVRGQGIRGFRRTFKELGGWSNDLRDQAMALADEQFVVTYSTGLTGLAPLADINVKLLGD